MARCGCAGTSCSCVVQGGSGITVDGAGTETNPYIISGSGGAGGGGVLTVRDTQTVDLGLLGAGTVANPYILSADATVALDDLTDVDAANPASGNVLAWNGTTWQPIPPTTAPVGAVAVGEGLLGDGSAGDPVRLDPAAISGFVVPTGMVVPFAGAAAPSGYLLANGAAVGRAAFAALFDVIGITYGAGNGTTTFNVPNLTNRMAVGAGGTYTLGEFVGATTHTHSTPGHTHPLPNHTHSVPAHEHNLGSDGVALINIQSIGGNDDIFMRRSTTATWEANRRTNLNINSGASSAENGTGAPLQGTTNFAGPWTTGAGGLGNTGSGGTGNTGASSSLPPSLPLNYIIKT